MPATPEQRAAFGQALRSARQQRGMTMQQVVDELRAQDPTLSTPRLSAWEKGQYAPSSSAKVTMLDDFFELGGKLRALLDAPPPAPSEIEELRRRVEVIEAHLGIGAAKPERHLRAASAGKPADPGPLKQRGKPRPSGAPSEFE